MNIAILTSSVLLLVVLYVPFLREVFNTIPLGWEHWRYVLPLIFVPFTIAEITKLIVMRGAHRAASA